MHRCLGKTSHGSYFTQPPCATSSESAGFNQLQAPALVRPQLFCKPRSFETCSALRCPSPSSSPWRKKVRCWEPPSCDTDPTPSKAAARSTRAAVALGSSTARLLPAGSCRLATPLKCKSHLHQTQQFAHPALVAESKAADGRPESL